MNIADEVLAGGRPDAVALIAGERHLTYADLDALANRAANRLSGLGIATGDRVMLQMADSPELIAAYLGTIRLGAVAVAVSTFWGADELAFAIADSGACALLVDPAHRDDATKALAELTNPPAMLEVDRDGFADSASTPVAVARRVDDIALWIYTSGTTGRPKAAMHRHGGLRATPGYLEAVIGLRADDRVLITSKLFFAFAAAHGVFGTLSIGATLILHAPWPDAESVADLIGGQRPTVLFAVPSLYNQLLRLPAGDRDFGSLRACFSAGEKLPVPVFEAWRAHTGLEIREGLGTTETMFLFLINAAGAARPGCTGLPAPGVRLRLHGRDGGALSAAGAVGLLSVACPSLFAGYWHRDDLNARTLDGDWYRTGDLFRCDDSGRWYHEGRADDLVKIAGQWLNPHEIEACIQEDSAGAEIAVIGAPGENGLERIVLFAAGVDSAQRQPFERMVRERVPARLGRNKLPKEIRFIDALPRTATGKVKRYVLRTMIDADG